MLIDYLFCLFQEIIILIADILFSNYYVPKVKINDFNVLIDGKCFFDLAIRNEEEAHEKIIEMSNNNDCTTGNLIDHAYYKKNLQINCN